MGLRNNTNAVASICLIESDASENADFSRQLTIETGITVHSFHALKDAFSAENPCIILLDMKMMDNANTIARLKERFAAPVIILSDRPSMAVAVKAMRAGACDFFPKPASISAIAKRINGLLKDFAPSFNQAQRNLDIISPYWEQERDIIESALSAFNGNISRAAAALQISPSTIYRKKQSWDKYLVNLNAEIR